MASSRPFLILRQLPLLSSMLRGRTRHDFFEFKVQHHLPLMVNTIGILQQLTPFVYREIHASQLSDIMETLWQMIRNYCHRARRQMMPILIKTLTITHDYLSNAPEMANRLLAKHQMTFQTLSRLYIDHEAITPLVAGLQSAVSSWANKPDTGNLAASSVRPSVVDVSSSTTCSRDSAMPFYTELISENQDLENILQVLADFDESSKRRIDNIAPYLPHLRRVFSKNRDPAARKAALSAALRHVRAFPECAETEIYPEYISCLRELCQADCTEEEEKYSDKKVTPPQLAPKQTPDALSSSLLLDTATVARDLLQFLPDMVVLCRENALQLLGAAFDNGAKCGGAFSYPKSIAADKPSNRNETSDVTNLLAKSLWLLCGLDENDMKLKPHPG